MRLSEEIQEKEVEKETEKHGYDIIVASCLWLLTLGFCVESVRLSFFIDIPSGDESNWLIAPGMMPLLLSSGLLIMLTTVIIYSYRNRRLYNNDNLNSLIKKWVADSENKQKLAQAILLIIFIFAMVGRMHFGIAVGLYLFSAMALARAGKLYWLAITALLFASAITFIFGNIMKIPLP